ncbi:MAG: DUF1858 domain-containing protein [Candidatus Diapherotrites archaeon]|nr:DUF1858 domain-containing protein [Candidatus Diapherotrites archaeon]
MAKKIERNTTLGEVVSNCPEAIPAMLEKGLHCVGCHVAGFETVEQGAKAHGMDEKEIDSLLKEMNEAIKKEAKSKKK